VGVNVAVAVGVGVAVRVGLGVAVAVGVGVGVWVGLGVAVAVGVGVDVWVGLGVAVAVGVGVRVGVRVTTGVNVGTGVGVGVSSQATKTSAKSTPANIIGICLIISFPPGDAQAGRVAKGHPWPPSPRQLRCFCGPDPLGGIWHLTSPTCDRCRMRRHAPALATC
jgi:hypothetical protein